jgi:PAS domain-containing protein
VDERASAIFGLPGAGVYSEADAFARVAPDHLDRLWAGALGVMGIEHPFDPSNLGRTIDFEYDLIHADGTRRSILSAGVIFEDCDGPRRMVGAFNDVTELRQAQAQIAHQNATLEKRVTDDTFNPSVVKP